MKILFICSNLIGDTILSSGAINHFIHQNQEAELTFVVGPTAAPLLTNYKNIENIIVFKKRKLNLHWLDIFKKTYRIKWDIIVDFRSSVLSLLLKNNKKYIFKKLHNIHHIEQLNSFFGFECSNLFIPTSDDEANKVNNDLDNSFKHIVIFPGGNWTPKLWSAENFNETMKLLEIQKDSMVKFLMKIPKLYYTKSHFPLEISQRAFDHLWRVCESYEMWCKETKQGDLITLKILD